MQRTSNELSNRCILLIDDNDHDRELAGMVLQDLAEAHEETPCVAMLDGGQAALDYFAKLGPSDPLPAVVLLDLNMPQVDGLGVLQAVRQNPLTAVVPVVMFSTSSERNDVARAYENGANAYLTKSLDYDNFRQTMASLLDFWTNRNHVIAH